MWPPPPGALRTRPLPRESAASYLTRLAGTYQLTEPSRTSHAAIDRKFSIRTRVRSMAEHRSRRSVVQCTAAWHAAEAQSVRHRCRCAAVHVLPRLLVRDRCPGYILHQRSVAV
ncbi:hypothetical protein Sfr7A_26325 [Streptomyces xinghaiensis]|uniref:Uncharacterized protein n=1 Tax=Streptomyces xinghaiensis TaxID=1038928 RepID=A0A420UY51_9ACTN|nr:hypothetical protein Sfr7A_26325 [Streptomyces xinghaiensis]RKM92641.1 hypothetical protein SFRA_024980 [Streptomyces xinghaiensis]RNC70609.1 hypothetical protein DC095_025970 [Streptomyces xinghaiensis]